LPRRSFSEGGQAAKIQLVRENFSHAVPAFMRVQRACCLTS